MPRLLLLKALLAGRLFYWLLFPLTAQATPLCAPPHIDREVEVRYVHDGDTLHLKSGEKVRLIGIDTPELARQQRPAEALALQARDRLRQLVKNSRHRLRLKLDKQHHDRYGRLLAHLYTQDNNSLSAQLLREGLATLLAIPPNLTNLHCYAREEKHAQQSRQGLWQLPRYQITDSQLLARNARGYRRIRGKVTRIGESRRNLWLNLSGNVAFRIEKSELQYFNGLKLRALRGKTIIGSGWLYKRNGELRMQIRTPYALKILH